MCLIIKLIARRHIHKDVIISKHFPRYYPLVRGIHRWIPLSKASDVELWWFLDLRLNKRLNKPSKSRWFDWDAIALIMTSLSCPTERRNIFVLPYSTDFTRLYSIDVVLTLNSMISFPFCNSCAYLSSLEILKITSTEYEITRDLKLKRAI